MKRKTICSFIVSLLLLITCFVCIGCGLNGKDIESYYNLSAVGAVYFEGEQTITLKQEEHSENKTTFKDTITASDITVSGVLAGKSVKSIKYISETELLLTLEGKVSADKSHKEETGTITVSYTALGNGANGNALLRVDFEPKMVVTHNLTNTFIKKYVSEFTLPYGSFIEENVNKDNIDVPVSDGVIVNMSVTDEGALRIEVIGFEPVEYKGETYNYPMAKISANVTTFNKDLYVNIGESVWLGYELT